jgi:hypothetical protein
MPIFILSVKDDKEGLAQLHEYLNYSDMAISPRLQDFSRESERRLSSASSIKSERRHSLPTNTSSLSLVDEYCTTTPRPVVMDFQARRRRATKLTQFFGVDYRELISDVLESIESGLEFERRHGTLNPDEAEVGAQTMILAAPAPNVATGIIGSFEKPQD